MRNKVPTLPIGTTIQSPSNNMYKVSNTKRESPYLLILEIVLASPTSEALPLDEQLYLTVGLIWPNAGMKWKIANIPVVDKVKAITYIDQHVPSMLGLKVDKNTTDDDLMFNGSKRKAPTREDAIILDTERIETDFAGRSDRLCRQQAGQLSAEAN